MARQVLTPRPYAVIILILLSAALVGCGGANQPGTMPTVDGARVQPADHSAGWPVSLPADRLQPWEELSPAGYAARSGEREGPRETSGINSDSEFVPGRERYTEAGDVDELGEASRLLSGDPGGGQLSCALYRLELQGRQPGALSADVNLSPRGDGSASEYWLGLSDYRRGSWQWHGPFREPHLRLSLPAGNYLSPFGNLFVAVVVYDGARLDVIGVGANPRDEVDATPPSTPPEWLPALQPVAGGLLLEWLPATAHDLAGYRIHYAARWFGTAQSPGARAVDYLEGGTRFLLTGLTSRTYVRIGAVDISGNESELSEIVVGEPLAGETPAMTVQVSAPSGQLGESISLTASGAEAYDFDLDGDGIYDVTGDPSGTASVNTEQTGIIRPGVRGRLGGETMMALGGVSLLITGNSRPVASGYASPPTGSAPLVVMFSGSGTDFDGEVVGGGWDFDGDGNYDVWDEASTAMLNPPPHEFPEPGFFNAKLRVVDDQDAWDVDTVSVFVLPPEPPPNEQPTAYLLRAPASGDLPLTVYFDASTSTDPDGEVVRFDFDFDDDGIWEAYDAGPTVSWVYTEPGGYMATVRVTDNRGAQDLAQAPITVNAPGNAQPTAAAVADHPEGSVPHFVRFDAGSSSDPDGTIVEYAWDFEGDGSYDSSGPVPTVDHTFHFAGFYDTVLRVTDNLGAQDTTTVAITAHGWRLQTIGPSGGGGGGGCTALAIVSGNPALTYYESIDATTGKVLYVRANDAYGASWGTVRGLANVGTIFDDYCDLAVVGGNPGVCYIDNSASTEKLVFRRGSDANGDAWGTAVTVHTTPDYYSTCSLAEVGGRPAIAFHPAHPTMTGELMYIRANNAEGSSWGALITVDSGGKVGEYCSLAMVSGAPGIAYYDDTGNDLLFILAMDATGATWPAMPNTVDSNGGLYASLAIVHDYSNMVPAICYRDPAMGLKYIQALDIVGSVWWPPQVLDADPDAGIDACLASNPGLGYLGVCHYDVRDFDLNFVPGRESVSGEDWGEPQHLDTPGYVGSYCSMVFSGNQPAVAYYDESSDTVKYGYLY